MSSAGDEVALESRMVVFCTGSSPRTVALLGNPPLLPLETALTPRLLGTALDRTRRLAVGVMGWSHSAVLALINLVRLARTTHPALRVRWFARSPTFRYAEPQDSGAWILYNNAGLKGAATDFARAELDGNHLAAGTAGAVVERIDYGGGEAAERAALAAWALSYDHVVQAIGFEPGPVLAGGGGGRLRLSFNHETGAFDDAIFVSLHV